MEEKTHLIAGKTYTFVVSNIDDAIRLDQYLTRVIPAYSRTFLQRLIQNGSISVNQTVVVKPRYLLSVHDVITLTVPQPDIATAEDIDGIDIQVIHEEKDFLILNKPAGLVIHQAKQHHHKYTLIDWLVKQYDTINTIGYIDRPGIVHRLDKDTSGLLIIARTNYAHQQFTQMFKDRTIHKTYHAIVHGHPEPSGTITLPIGRHPVTPYKMHAFNEQDKKKYPHKPIRTATTAYQVLEYYPNNTYVELKPLTGRTHQIRVHLSAIGNPIVSDPTYGGTPLVIARQALHAYQLQFNFNGKDYTFTAPIPADFEQLIAQLKKSVNY